MRTERRVTPPFRARHSRDTPWCVLANRKGRASTFGASARARGPTDGHAEKCHARHAAPHFIPTGVEAIHMLKIIFLAVGIVTVVAVCVLYRRLQCTPIAAEQQCTHHARPSNINPA